MSSHRGNFVSNQNIVTFENAVIFVSYGSIIVVEYKGVTYLGKDWDYSRTTGKYRNNFLGETKKETQEKLDSGIYKLLRE